MADFQGNLNVNKRGGSSNNRKRIPGFDDYKGMADQIEKYGEELRKYFAMAQTHDDLDQAREELEDNEQTHYPDKIVSFFYNERKKSLGPSTKANDPDEKWDDSEVNLNRKIQRGKEAQQAQWTKYRPTWT